MLTEAINAGTVWDEDDTDYIHVDGKAVLETEELKDHFEALGIIDVDSDEEEDEADENLYEKNIC